jgi:hypothetical protein
MAPMTLSLVSPLSSILAWAMAASGLYLPFFSCEHDDGHYANACGKGLKERGCPSACFIYRNLTDFD